MPKEERIKIAITGDKGVGKTSLIKKYVFNSFNPNESPTEELRLAKKDYFYQNINYTMEIIDIPHHAISTTNGTKTLKTCEALVVLFLISKRYTFAQLPMFVKLFSNMVPKDVVHFLVGHKADLSLRQVSQEEVCKYIEKTQFSYVEVSSLTGTNLQFLFTSIFKEVIKKRLNLPRKKIIEMIKEKGNSLRQQPPQPSTFLLLDIQRDDNSPQVIELYNAEITSPQFVTIINDNPSMTPIKEEDSSAEVNKSQSQGRKNCEQVAKDKHDEEIQRISFKRTQNHSDLQKNQSKPLSTKLNDTVVDNIEASFQPKKENEVEMNDGKKAAGNDDKRKKLTIQSQQPDRRVDDYKFRPPPPPPIQRATSQMRIKKKKSTQDESGKELLTFYHDSYSRQDSSKASITSTQSSTTLSEMEELSIIPTPPPPPPVTSPPIDPTMKTIRSRFINMALATRLFSNFSKSNKLLVPKLDKSDKKSAENQTKEEEKEKFIYKYVPKGPNIVYNVMKRRESLNIKVDQKVVEKSPTSSSNMKMSPSTESNATPQEAGVLLVMKKRAAKFKGIEFSKEMSLDDEEE